MDSPADNLSASEGDTDTEKNERSSIPPLEDNLIVISNRQPYQHCYTTDGSIEVNRPAGGLTAGLDPVMQRTNGTWVAWSDGEADAEVTDEDGTVQMPPEEEAYTLQRVWLSEEEVEGYYYGYSNRVLWPLCHGGGLKTEYVDRHWARYQQINERFADVVTDHVNSGSIVWFQDYHFSLAPRYIRNASTDTFLLHFWHITWPGWDTFRTCPHRQKLLDGLLGNDLLGFHIERYCKNFLDCVDECLDSAVVNHDDSQIHYNGQTTTVRAFPMGIDAETIQMASERMDKAFWDKFRCRYDISGKTKVVIGVDRLDYTKGISERLDALERLWTTKPEWRGELTYVQKVEKSRSLIPAYQTLQQNVKEAVERINNRFGTDEWQPVIQIENWLTEEELAGLYRHGDVLLVSAVRDGMNLVAKEYVAAQIDDPGVLVLSNQTGAHDELGESAVTINPYDTDGFAAAIESALLMDAAERQERMTTLQQRIVEQNLTTWMANILETTQRLQNGN
ncbi:alpha,alpha-trehalose-phosphate synthase (UDP-forming) [Haladaptatus halobius]|uniref:alpha,alpha-trehalose-phosphate synthase (UDP-forming) n=1 Tax=Haladaptatus halobius TaxID=2884875 RepID=UPI001D0B169B|nr:trehalose-6-phosphate synthase [Haladaptatus halobius]